MTLKSLKSWFAQSDWVKILAIWLVWRVALFWIGAAAHWVVRYDPSFPYYEYLLPSFGWPQWVYSWANFDGVHYLRLADLGYFGVGLVQAFFPVLPGLMAGLHASTHLDLLFSGLVLSQLCSLATCFMLVYWWRTDLRQKMAYRGLLWWLVFPTVFFTVALYSESLFFVFSLGCWLAARKGRWWLAGGLAAVASATRVVGIWLVPMLLLELLTQTHWPWRLNGLALRTWFKQHGVKLLAVASGSLGLLAYMGYLWWQFHDPLFFLHQQSAFGAGRQESLVLWPQVVWRSLHILLTARPFDFRYFIYLQEFVAGVGSVCLIGVGWWWRKTTHLTTPLAIYSLGCVLMPTFTGTFSSLPRYVLAAWPIWLVLLAWSNKSRWAWLGMLFSLVLLILNTIWFIQGYWVA